MYKLSICFLCISVLFFACTQESSTDSDGKKGFKNISPLDKDAEKDIPVPTPIPPPNVPAAPVIKSVPQAPKKDLKYPKEFNDMGVSMYKGTSVENNVVLDNSQGKFGRRIKLSGNDSFEKVMEFYAEDLVKKGWAKDSKMDKVRRDEHVTYFSTNYTKDNYTLMHSIMATSQGKVNITQILKEN